VIDLLKAMHAPHESYSDAGKPARVALTAVMRTLIVLETLSSRPTDAGP